jgi:UDP-N-acetylmuramate dehydrogenase
MDIEKKIQTKVNLARYTTFKIGGEADYFVQIDNKEELVAIFDWVKEKKFNHFLLGGGSNIVVNDLGFRGIIIKLNNYNIVVKGDRLECGAGVLLGQTINTATSQILSGLEWGIGIPGTIGGAVHGNAGCFGFSISDFIETIEVFDLNKNEYKLFSRNDCQFDYRESIFKYKKNLIIWQVLLKLNKGIKENINIKLNEIINKRNQSQPKLPSAGSVFKNIMIKDLRLANIFLAQKAENSGVVKDNKVSAGWLIDQLELKGKNFGDIKISLEHANFIINTGKGKAQDFVMLTSFIKTQIRDEFGIQLQEEIEYVGF